MVITDYCLLRTSLLRRTQGCSAYLRCVFCEGDRRWWRKAPATATHSVADRSACGSARSNPRTSLRVILPRTRLRFGRSSPSALHLRDCPLVHGRRKTPSLPPAFIQVFFFLLSVLWGGWVGHYLPQEVFAKFGYRLESAYYEKKLGFLVLCVLEELVILIWRFQFFSQNLLNL